MTAKFFFNALVLLAFTALVVYAISLGARGRWDQGTFFLVLAVFIFSNFEISRGRIVR